jgi:probable HAF family extracellular repeat protein
LGGFGGDTVASRGNDSDQIAGYSQIAPGGARHAFVFSNGTMTDIHPGAGWNESLGFAIDATGTIVIGSAYDTNNVRTAAIWINGTFYRLQDLVVDAAGWEFKSAGYINGSGQIAGYGMKDGVVQTFLLTPVASTPEPSTAIAVIALAALWMGRKLN